MRIKLFITTLVSVCLVNLPAFAQRQWHLEDDSAGHTIWNTGWIFFLIGLIVSFFVMTWVFDFVGDNFTRKIQTLTLVILPVSLLFATNYSDSKLLGALAVGSVFSAIYYSAILRKD